MYWSLNRFCRALVLVICVGVNVDVGASHPAEQAVYAQLEALQDWDGRGIDEALRRVWELAHPNNQRVTGPIERFAQLLAGPGYKPLIGHQTHKVASLDRNRGDSNDADTARFSVSVLATDGLLYVFVWQLGRAELPDRKAWLTTGVSQARSTGKQLSRVVSPMKKAVSLR